MNDWKEQKFKEQLAQMDFATIDHSSMLFSVGSGFHESSSSDFWLKIHFLISLETGPTLISRKSKLSTEMDVEVTKCLFMPSVGTTLQGRFPWLLCLFPSFIRFSIHRTNQPEVVRLKVKIQRNGWKEISQDVGNTVCFVNFMSLLNLFRFQTVNSLDIYRWSSCMVPVVPTYSTNSNCLRRGCSDSLD